ncbi:MAG TPA: rhomboid family intramembrane serine protease [Longimicrobiales bacterium]
MTPVVANLLIANIAAFVLQNMIPGLTHQFAYVPILALRHPWTIVTSMFLHGGVMHIFFNMLGLYFFGSAVESRLGAKRFTILYFISGFTGALFSTISPLTAIIGASGGVFGVMLAFARFWPATPIYIWGIFPVPARILVIVTTIITLYSGLTGVQDGIAHFAHLGGYAGAWLYLRGIERKSGQFKRRASKPTKEAVSMLDRWEAIDLTKVHQVNRDEVTRLIEKARTNGVRSLTPQEQSYLAMFVPSERPEP